MIPTLDRQTDRQNWSLHAQHADMQQKVDKIPQVVAYLWCYVVWSTTERLCIFSRKDAFLTHSKISNFAMAIGIKEYIIQFQISAANR